MLGSCFAPRPPPRVVRGDDLNVDFVFFDCCRDFDFDFDGDGDLDFGGDLAVLFFFFFALDFGLLFFERFRAPPAAASSARPRPCRHERSTVAVDEGAQVRRGACE